MRPMLLIAVISALALCACTTRPSVPLPVATPCPEPARPPAELLLPPEPPVPLTPEYLGPVLP